jgi:hypothetical protein
MATCVVLFASVTTGLYLYLQFLGNLKTQVQAGLVHLAQAAVPLIEVSEHEKFTDPAQDLSEAHLRAMQGLRRFRNANPDIKFVYTCRSRGGKFHFVYDPTDDGDGDGDGHNDRSLLLEEYKEATSTMHDVITTRRSLAEPEPAKDQWGIFMSGYAPLLNSAGVVVGLVGVDLGVSDYENRLAGAR